MSTRRRSATPTARRSLRTMRGASIRGSKPMRRRRRRRDQAEGHCGLSDGDKVKPRQAPAERRANVIRIGTREMESRGAPGGFWTDLYHRSMTVHWPVFFGSAALIFIVLNTVFGLLF